MIVLREKIFRKDYRLKALQAAAEKLNITLPQLEARRRNASKKILNSNNLYILEKNTEKLKEKGIDPELVDRYKKNALNHKWNLRNKQILSGMEEGLEKASTRKELGNLGHKRRKSIDFINRGKEASSAREALQKKAEDLRELRAQGN